MPLTTTPTNALTITALDTITLSGAEIAAYDAASKRIFVTSNTGLNIVDATDPANLALVTTVNFTAPGFGFNSTDITSVAAKNGIIAVALPDAVKTNNGKVVFLDANGALLGSVNVGALPDMLTFTPDGTKVLVANEGEVAADGTDPAPGSVSIIDIAGGVASATVQTAGFTSFNGQEQALRDAGVRIFPGKSVSQDVEPEYIAISPDGTKAMVTLQEANAVAILDIATATFTAIKPLGLKDFSTLQADFSDRDSATNGTAVELKTGAPVFGMYMPDGIAAYQANGNTYYVIANEGDDRDDFLNPDETIRVNATAYDLDNTLFPNEGTAGTASVAGTGLKGNDSIGRLTVSNVALAPGMGAGLSGDLDAERGQYSAAKAMLLGEGGYTLTTLFTVGETLTGTTGALNTTTAGNYQPVGVLDGIGAYSLDASTVRVFVNQELANNRGTSYTLENGVTLTGARISYFDIDKVSKGIKDAGIAYGEVYDRAGNLVTVASQLDVAAGFDRFCSGSVFEAGQFSGRGLADRIYFAGEESSTAFGHPYGGSQWALDTTTGNLWAVPAMGRGSWENVAEIDTGTTTHVAFIMGDDGPNGMPLYLYVGQKNAAGDFLDRNGLKNGQTYVWKADTAGVNSPAEFAAGTQAGTWVPIQVQDVTKAGMAGYDSLGYKTDATLRAEADSLGAFSFSRPEDVSTNPTNGTQVAFASTGASIVAGNTADGVADATDVWGTVYTINVNLSNLAAPTASLNVIYNGNTDATRALRSPDNLDWADDGFIYVNEDRSTNWAGAVAANPNEASIVKIDPATGVLTRVSAVDRSAVPPGQNDSLPGDFGNWESSGILDVSALFGQPGGKLFLTDVQAHSISLGTTSLVEGGQLALISAPGVAAPVRATGDIEKVVTYGGRSFSVLDANGNIILDSADIIERVVATNPVAFFDDTRSDNKGPEPENVTIGAVGGKTYAFVGLERSNAVMTFDITDPLNPTYTGYTTNYNKATSTGDVSPEGLLFVDGATDDMLIVSNEVSNTLSVFAVEQNFQLQLLHYYGESGLLGVDTAPIMGAMIDRFDDQYVNTLVLGEGDSFIPGPWLVAGADPSLNAAPGIGATALARPDIAIMNAFGTDASALGNHEFDLGSPVLQGAIAPSGAWVGAQFPLITSNLTFSADSALRGLADATLGGTGTNAFAGQEASAIKAKIAPYTVVTMGGEKVGIVGLTTWDLLSKSSPNGTAPKDDANPATSDLQEAAAYVQASVNALNALGVNKIVMVDQLDELQRNKDLAPLVTGIDVMIAGGGHERMGDATDTPVAFPGHDPNFIADAYPIVTAGADGAPTLIVTTDTEYTYLGRLVVNFDSAGVLDVAALNTSINGAYAANEATLQSVYGSAQTAQQIVASSTIGSQVSTIVNAIDAVVTAKDGNVFGYTNVYLEGDRVFGRTQEVNLGDISADANREMAAISQAGQPFIVSLKNGGGIRASIGAVDASGNKIPPLASDVKPNGAISQLDIENALRFDNKLMVFDTTPQQLLNILNFAAGLSSGPNQQSGGYPQVGGIRFSYDPDSPAGAKIANVSLVDDNGEVIARVVENGVVVAGAPALISVVTLNFTANGGDSYPIKANGDNFRYILTDGTLSGPIAEGLDFTAAANIPANAMGEQFAFQAYLLNNHATPATAYSQPDTAASADVRIENLNFRTTDVVFQGVTRTGTAAGEVLNGTAGDDVLNGLGSTDGLYGGAGNDSLDGGAGSDGLVGGAGNDTYTVDTYLDTVIEDVNGGIDTVISSDSHFLAANVENLTLTGAAGLGAVGNELANVITGNDGANGIAAGLGNDTVNGGAGADTIDGQGGADSMSGGTGVDTYFVDDNGDAVAEDANGGEFDTIWTTVTVTLPTNVEIVILNGGVLAIGATGNAATNLMLGNDAANTMSGLAGNEVILGLGGNDTIDGGADFDIIFGGAGADLLTGGTGNDYFGFTNVSEAGDTITDFTTAGPDVDILDLRPLFPTFTNTAGITTVAQAVASGHLGFTQNGAATNVFADADGTAGGGAAVLLATLQNTTAANAQIFTLI